MIKKETLIIVLFCFGLSLQAQAQPVRTIFHQAATPDSATAEKITINDLKPPLKLDDNRSLFQTIREKPGAAFLSSAIIPGSGQAVNGKWYRAGIYLLAEIAAVGLHFRYRHKAKKQQRRYENFADNNWSVVNYAHWLVQYYDANPISNPDVENLRDEISGVEASYTPREDWAKIDIELLRSIERETPFVFPDRTGNNFSHTMPEYGSQQYYELISKYYQYGPGWNDFGRDRFGEILGNPYRLEWNGSNMPLNFFTGSEMAETFNNSYRFAGNMISLVILNHIVSAFDSFLTVKIKNKRLRANANPLTGQAFSFQYHF